MSYFSDIIQKPDNNLEFVVNSNKNDDIDKSFINGIRRTILSEFPTYSFNSEPYQDCDIKIIDNTSSLHNEFISHRIGLLPVNVSPIDNFYDDKFAFVSCWEFMGENKKPKLNKEILSFEAVKLKSRSYK